MWWMGRRGGPEDSKLVVRLEENDRGGREVRYVGYTTSTMVPAEDRGVNCLTMGLGFNISPGLCEETVSGKEEDNVRWGGINVD